MTFVNFFDIYILLRIIKLIQLSKLIILITDLDEPIFSEVLNISLIQNLPLCIMELFPSKERNDIINLPRIFELYILLRLLLLPFRSNCVMRGHILHEHLVFE